MMACRRWYERRKIQRANIIAATKGIETPRYIVVFSESPVVVDGIASDVPDVIDVPAVPNICNLSMVCVFCKGSVGSLV